MKQLVISLLALAMAVPAPAAPDNEWTIKAGDFNAEGTPF